MRKRILSALLLLLTAGTAVAASYCYIDEFVVPADMIGGEVVVPVKAHFDARVQALDVSFTFPEGITPIAIEAGADSEITYQNQRGRYATNTVTPYANQGNTHVQCATTATGYWDPDGDGTFESYGNVKWEAGEYNEMFLLYLNVSPEFTEGEIVVTTTPTSTSDTRGGTVLENGDHNQQFSMSGYIYIGVPTIPSPIPVIMFEQEESGNVIVKVNGEGWLNGEILVNGEYIAAVDGDKQFEYVIEPEYDYSKYIEVHAMTLLEGYLPSEMVVASYELGPKERPLSAQPIISFEEIEDGVMIHVTGNGDLFGEVTVNGIPNEIYGNKTFEFIVEKIYDDYQMIVVRAYAIDGYEYVQSEEVTMQYELAPKERPLSAMPTVVFDEMDDVVVIRVAGNGELYGQILVNDQLLTDISGYQTFECVVNRVYDYTQHVLVSTYAIDGPEYQQSDVIYHQYILEPLQRPESPIPEISFVLLEDGVVAMVNGYGDVHVTIAVNGNDFIQESFQEYSEFFFPASVDQQSIHVEAFCIAPECSPSPVVMGDYVVPAKTPAPVIECVVEDYQSVITVTGEGHLTLYVERYRENGDVVEARIVADGPSPLKYYIPRDGNPERVVVQASAQLPDAFEGRATEEFIVPATSMSILPSPDISYELNSDEVIITLSGDYFLVLYVDGEEVGASYGYVVYKVPRGEENITIVVRGENHAGPGNVPGIIEETITVPAREKTYDFVEDGIYYKIWSSESVMVTYASANYNSYSGKVNIPASVTHDGKTYMVRSINDRAFKDCSGLTSVTIGSNVTSIGADAFRDCTGLTSVEVGNYVITIGTNAFMGCTSLAKVTLGFGIRNIGLEAFKDCPALTSVICKAAVPPVMASSDCFDCYATATLTVHPAVINDYRISNDWKKFTSIVCREAIDPVQGDTNGDGIVNISDVTSLIDQLLGGGH